MSNKKKKLSIKEKVWIWPGESANWFFVYVDTPGIQKIREETKGKRGFGAVRVRATLRGSTWESSMFWSKKDKCYIFPLKAQVRKKEDVLDGDEVKITFELI
jgi:hypothetical protein